MSFEEKTIMVFTVWKRLEMADDDIAITVVIEIVKSRLHPISGTEPIDPKCIINKLKGKVFKQDDYIDLRDAADNGVKHAQTDEVLLQWATFMQFLLRVPANNVRHVRNDPRNRVVVRRVNDKVVG